MSSDDPRRGEGVERFRQFRRSRAERTFAWPICHRSKTGFCPCEGTVLERLRLYARGTLMEAALRLPFNRPKIRVLRWAGVEIGRNCYISANVWIDPLFPELVSIKDFAVIGAGARIVTHVFDRDRFVAGRITIGEAAIVGGFSIVGPGVEIGREATVAVGAVVGRDVPPGRTAIGNPARIITTPKHTAGDAQ